MNRLVLIILLFAVVSCNYDNQKQQFISARLSNWDEKLADQYSQISDSLSSIDTRKLSTQNRHYHTLLSAIAGTWSGKTLTNDSALLKATSWFRSRKDYRNVCRAIIYNRSNLEEQYDRLIEAEELFNRHKINDSLTEAYLYMYLSEAIFRSSAGVSLSRQTAAQKSESYKSMSVAIFMKIGRLREAQNLLINSYNLYPVYMTPEKKLDNLKEIELFDTIYPEVKAKLLMIYANYYFSINSKEGFKYLNDYIAFEGDQIFRSKKMVSAFSTLSAEYKKIGELDSALHYAKLFNKSLLELQADAFDGYHLLSSVYAEMGDSNNAYKNHLLFHKAFSYRKSTQYQDALLRNRAITSDFEKRIKRLKRERAFAIYGTVLFMGGLFAFAIFFVFKRRIGITGNEKVTEQYKAQLIELTELYKKGKFTNEVLKASAGLMPSFIDTMAKEAGRCRKSSQETFDNILNNISTMRQSGRDIISDISKSEEFAEFFPEIASYKELSSYERVVLALFEMGYSPKEISNLISTTPASVRSIKAKIKDKLPSLSMPGEGENQSEDN
ncbi:MAG: hypothetical protein CVU12_02205 [Bacteroidetes bacterium HGW-Bacteroidetes-7]|nr:MAG: hypothetical protein CVU12_02205 [Bacteroidetes bacterium HGW-Bacteroidetes-7]